MKKRILLIASRPLADDGITKIELDIIKFNKNIVEFEVACGFGFNNKYGRELKDLGIKCCKLPQKKDIYKYMSGIARLVKVGGYDAVYIHGNSAMMFLETFPSKVAKTRVITHCHNTKSDFPVVHHIIKPFFNMFVDEKVGCSSAASRWAYCGKRISTIVNGIDINRFKFDYNKREKMRNLLGWSDNKIIGHIGRFDKQKNHKKVINIFSKMYKENMKCRLLLIGSGELRTVIENQIEQLNLKKAVSFIEYTDKPEDYMQAMDVMIMPSLFEGLCLVAVEAQANGLPVLIDNFFPPETSASDIVVSLDLKESDEKWANVAFELIKTGRRDVSKQLKEKNMEYRDMMIKIQKILLK